MNIFHKIALQGLKNNRSRTIVTVIGTALSAALFTAITTFGTSLVSYMIKTEIAKGGNWHIVCSDIVPSERQEWEEDEEIADIAAYENLGYALLEGAGEAGGEKPYLFIAGFSDETFEKLPVSLTAGRWPENSSEILVPSDSIEAKAGVRISLKDELTLDVGERENNGEILTQCDGYTETEKLINTKARTYTVVGTFERPGFEVHSSPGYTLITKAEEEKENDSYSFYIALKNPRRTMDYVARKAETHSCGVNENLLRFMGVSDNKVFNAFLYSIGGVLVLIIMTGSVFLIYNSFHISLNERVRQYGLLMSVGATEKQLRGAVLFEGICIGIIGIPLGILAGIGCIGLLLPLVAKNFVSIVYYGEKLELAVSFPALALSALLGLVTILISAYIPAKKAAAVPIMDCIRQTGEIKTERKTVRTGKFARKLYGLEGMLALKNFRRNKKRYRSIVFSLTLSMILAVAGSAFGTSLKTLSGELIGQAADGDVAFMTQDMSEEAFCRLYDRMKVGENITRSTWQADYFYQAETKELPDDFLTAYRKAMGSDFAGDVQQVTLYTQFIEDDIYCGFVEELGLSVEEYIGQDAKVLICVMNTEEHTTYFAGESMHFSICSASGDKAKEICATFADSYPLDGAFVLEGNPPYVFIVTAPLSVKAQFSGLKTTDDSVHLGALFWSEMPTQVVRQIREILVSEEVMADYSLYNFSQAFELWRSTTFIIDIFTLVFTFMITLIAVANVFNTISTNISLRRRELAMLRSVGMSDKGFNRMMRFECLFYGMWTLLFGLPVSGLLSYLIHRVIMSAEKRDIAFVLPWGALGISTLGVFGIVFITMVYATGKVRKENIIDALRDEMG